MFNFKKSKTDQRGQALAESHYRPMPTALSDDAADEHAQAVVDEIKDRLSKGKQLTADQRSMLQAVGFSSHKLESMAKGGNHCLPGFAPLAEGVEDISKGDLPDDSKTKVSEEELIKALDKLDSIAAGL